MGEPGHRRLAAVFFSDIAGYSRQMDADEAGTLARLVIHNQILEEEIARRDGRVIKTVGDAYMAEFPSAVEAVTAALDAQRAFESHNAGAAAGERIEIRIGVHAGDVIERGGDLFGETVNQAARLEAKAPPGGLCVSAAVYDQVRKKVQATSEDLGEISLKGIEAPVHVFALRPAGAQLEPRRMSAPPPRGGQTPRGWARPWRIGLLLALGIGLVYLKTREPPPERAGGATSSAPSSASSASAAPAPHRGGALRVASSQSRGAFDYFYNVPSLSSSALELTNDTLFRHAEDGSVTPGAVDRWQSSADGHAVELHLRDGLHFHDHPCLPSGSGRAATARDLQFSLAIAATHGALPAPMLADPPNEGAPAPALRATTLLDERTVRVELAQAVAEPARMMFRIFLVPHELEGCQDVRKMVRPVGTGPFRFAADPTTDALRLVRSADAWERQGAERLPWIDAVELRYLEDSIEAVRLIAAGELDLYEGGDLSGEPAIELDGGVAKLKERLRSPHVSVALSVQSNRTELLALVFLPNQRKAPGALALRQAIAAALEPEILLDNNEHDVKPLGRFLDSRLQGYDPALPGISRRLPEAKRLLAAAQKERGQPIPELVIGARAAERAVGERIRDALADVSLRVRLVDSGGAALPSSIGEVQLDAVLIRVAVATYRDELAFHRLVALFDTLGPPDAELTRLVNELQGATDRAVRATLSRRIEQRLLEMLPAIPIGTLSPLAAATFWLVGPRVRGFADDVTGRVLPAGGAPYLRAHLVDDD